MFPSLEEFFCLFYDLLHDHTTVSTMPHHALSPTEPVRLQRVVHLPEPAYLLLSGLRDVLVGFEEAAEVERLAAPEVAVHGPVEGELEGAAVEGAEKENSGVSWFLARV